MITHPAFEQFEALNLIAMQFYTPWKTLHGGGPGIEPQTSCMEIEYAANHCTTEAL